MPESLFIAAAIAAVVAAIIAAVELSWRVWRRVRYRKRR